MNENDLLRRIQKEMEPFYKNLCSLIKLNRENAKDYALLAVMCSPTLKEEKKKYEDTCKEYIEKAELLEEVRKQCPCWT